MEFAYLVSVPLTFPELEAFVFIYIQCLIRCLIVYYFWFHFNCVLLSYIIVGFVESCLFTFLYVISVSWFFLFSLFFLSLTQALLLLLYYICLLNLLFLSFPLPLVWLSLLYFLFSFFFLWLGWLFLLELFIFLLQKSCHIGMSLFDNKILLSLFILALLFWGPPELAKIGGSLFIYFFSVRKSLFQ